MALELNNKSDSIESITVSKLYLNGVKYEPRVSSVGLDIPFEYSDSDGNKVCYLRIPMDLIKETLQLALERTNVEWM